MLDEYVFGDFIGKSPEAPVPLIKQKGYKKYVPGGAGNAVINLASLDAKPYIVGLRGSDVEGEILSTNFKQHKINVDCLLRSDSPTSLKTRIVCEGQQMIRFDHEKIESVSGSNAFNIFQFVKKRIRNIDGVLISDYNKGVCNEELMQNIIALCVKNKKPVVVDSKCKKVSKYKYATLFTPNVHDAKEMGCHEKKKHKPDWVIDFLRSLLQSNVLVTMGDKGMLFCDPNNKPVSIPTKPIEKCDATGAGDTVSASALLALCAGASPFEASEIAQMAARVVIRKVGTANVSVKELKDEINNF